MYRSLSFLLVAVSALAQSFEAPALQISRDIQARHLPFGTILNPVYPSPDSAQIVSYTRCGDSAIWTGHYLAAESFRYAVTHTPESLTAARVALKGIRTLVEITGADQLLARCAIRADSPFAADPRNEEKQHGEYRATLSGIDYYWIGNTSRDQFLGVFFGLGVAYDHLESEDRAVIRDVATKMIDRLLAKNWAVVMPNGDVSTVFWLRPDQQLAILQVGRRVNPQKFTSAYDDLRKSAIGIGLPIALEATDDHGSYFKFNLDAISLYNLLRLEEESSRRGDYIATYRTFRSAVASHGNAFFNVIDRALIGPNAERDAETARLLAQWLERPRRDFYVDVRGKYKSCGDDQTCDPIPVPERVRTDFLWQRSPFLSYGGGSGRVEGARHRFHPAVLDGPVLRSQLRSARRVRSQRRYNHCSRVDCVAARIRPARNWRSSERSRQRWRNPPVKRNLLLGLGADQLSGACGCGSGAGKHQRSRCLRSINKHQRGQRTARCARVVHRIGERQGRGRGAGDTSGPRRVTGKRDGFPLFRTDPLCC